MTGPPRPEPHDQVWPTAEASIPNCRTGPSGRLRFVIAELVALWRDRRRRALDPTSQPDPTGW
jgi:hypothetical protein